MNHIHCSLAVHSFSVCVKCQTGTSCFTPGETFTRLTRQQDDGCMEELVFSPQNDGRVTPSKDLILISI